MRLYTSIAEIGRDRWALVESAHYPFNDYCFLHALEESLSISSGSGWRPLYFSIEDQHGLKAAHPAFVKSNSNGEYIFDWDWARFYQQNQVAYYPKLLSAIPFTPATGPRLLVRDSTDQSAKTDLLVAALDLAKRSGMSSYHALFLEPNEGELFRSQSCLQRHSIQFHWTNRSYRDFADFLEGFQSKRRRDIQRERRRVKDQGLHIERLSGTQLTPDLAAIMEELYLTTIDKKESTPYLQSGFFRIIFESMAESILLVVARDQGKIVAAALNFFKGVKLYGRYWGAYQHYPDLHFELCYYQTLEFAIEKGLSTFEAGAQGQHKIQRGFLPTVTLSAHQIFDPRFYDPIAQYIADEKVQVREAITTLERQSPFR